MSDREKAWQRAKAQQKKARQRAQARQNVADQLVQIIDRHLPAEGLTRKERYDDAINLRGFNWRVLLMGGWGKPKDRRALHELQKKLKNVVEEFKLLSPAMGGILDRSFRLVEFGDDERSLSDWNIPLDTSLVLRMLLNAVDEAVRVEAVGVDQGKANCEAVALEYACGVLWQDRTGRKRPMVSPSEGELAPEPVPYHRFCMEVFHLLGVTGTIASAQRAAQNAERR